MADNYFENLTDIITYFHNFQYHGLGSTHTDGYFNAADITDPPKLATDCDGGLQKTIKADINSEYHGRIEYELEDVHVLAQKGDDYQYSNHGTHIITKGDDDGNLVRCGWCIYAIEGSQVDVETSEYTAINERITRLELKFKTIDTLGTIKAHELKNTALVSGNIIDGWAEQDAVTHRWKWHGTLEPVSVQYDNEGYCDNIATNTSGLHGFNNGAITHILYLDFDVPFFDNEEDLDTWLETGEMVDPEEPIPTDLNTYYIETNTIKNTEPTEEGAEWVNHRRQEFTGLNGFLMKRYYVDDNVLPNNMKWGYNDALLWNSGTEIVYNKDGGISEKNDYSRGNGDSLASFINPYHCGEEWHQQPVTNLWYKSSIETNIAFVEDPEDDPQPPSPDPSKPNPTGEPDPSTDLPEITLDIHGSRCHILDSSNMAFFQNKLYSEDIIEDILEALRMYGQNPIDCVVDMYATPIDVSQFCTTSYMEWVTVGYYPIGAENLYVSNNNKMLTVATCEIRGTYNDWRDYDATYMLYLPYVGFTILDTQRYLNRLLTIKASYDVRTGALKYYVFSKGNLLDTYEGTVRVDMPLSSQDKASMPSRLIDASKNLVNGMAEIGNKNPAGVLDIVGGMIDTVNAMHPQMRISGNSSPANAIHDPTYPYLIIQQPRYLYPPLLASKFGLPDDSIAPLKQFKGYTVCSECDLNVIATTDELSEIESLLKQGVYI